MTFINHKNMMLRPFFACADIECTLKPFYESYENNIGKRKTKDKQEKEKGHRTHIHVPNSACFYVVSNCAKIKSRMWIDYGENCVKI